MMPGVMKEQFTTKAAILWSTVPERAREQILKNVFCTHCSGPAEMVNFQGKEQKGDLLLTGSCSKCGHKVVRVLETSEVRSDNN
jgi:hypothetical protein